jgi:hypothetical protein
VVCGLLRLATILLFVCSPFSLLTSIRDCNHVESQRRRRTPQFPNTVKSSAMIDTYYVLLFAILQRQMSVDPLCSSAAIITVRK